MSWDDFFEELRGFFSLFLPMFVAIHLAMMAYHFSFDDIETIEFGSESLIEMEIEGDTD